MLFPIWIGTGSKYFSPICVWVLSFILWTTYEQQTFTPASQNIFSTESRLLCYGGKPLSQFCHFKNKSKHILNLCECVLSELRSDAQKFPLSGFSSLQSEQVRSHQTDQNLQWPVLSVKLFLYCKSLWKVENLFPTSQITRLNPHVNKIHNIRWF